MGDSVKVSGTQVSFETIKMYSGLGFSGKVKVRVTFFQELASNADTRKARKFLVFSELATAFEIVILA